MILAADLVRPGIEYVDDFEPSFFTKESVYTFAANAADGLGFEPTSNIDQLIVELGGRVHITERSGLEYPFNGTILVHGEHDFDILIPDSTTPQTDRFTLAHEIGHYALHSKGGRIPIVADRHWGTSSERIEWEANWFAAGFLMPETAVRRFLEGNSRLSEIDLIYRVAGHFHVSPSAAEIRLKTLAIIPSLPSHGTRSVR